MSNKNLIAVFLISLCVLMFEISLVRIFSVLMRYHYVFLIVSMSMCGLGAGGLFSFYIQQKMKERVNPSSVMFFLAIGAGITMPLSIILLFKTPLKDFLTGYTIISFIPFIPFFFAGTFFSYIFENYGNLSGKIYFADLVGAGTGCILILFLINISGAINAVFVAGALCILGAMLINYKTLLSKTISLFFLFAIVGCLFANLNNKIFSIPYISTENPELIKPLFSITGNSDCRIVYTEWNGFARTDVVEFDDSPDIKYIYTDGDVPTTMHFFNGSLKSIESIKNTVFYLPFADMKNPKVLSIGPGGGVDILASILGGSTDITGVEVNPSMFSIMDKYSFFNGNLYKYHGVRVYLDDGRSFVKRTKEKYDLIYLALTQSATSQSTTGVLTEGYIHTKEAFKDYLEKLNDNGMLVFITQNELLLLRGFATLLSILNQPHNPAGLSSLMVFTAPEEMFETTPYRYILLAGKKPFSNERKERIKRFAEKIGIIPVFVPSIVVKPPFDRLAGFVGIDKFINEINAQLDKPVNLLPASDDKPFFLDLSYGIPEQFKKISLIIILFTIFLSGVVVSMNREEIRKKDYTIPFFIVYFALIGTAYMLIEVGLIQRFILFLGHPTFAVSIVLFGLLAGSGTGSLLTQRWKEKIFEKVMMVSFVVCVIVVFHMFFLPEVFDTFLYHNRYVRALISFLLIFPPGFLMGIPFPSAIRIMKQHSQQIIPWLWTINGVMSVSGSVVAIVIAKMNGFTAVFFTGGILYLGLSILCLLYLRYKKTIKFQPKEGDI